jgi:hypothetical protein
MILGLFALLGTTQLWIVKKHSVEAWPIYLLVLTEMSILVTAMIRSIPATRDMPISISCCFDHFAHFFLLIANVAFSY